MNQDESLQNTKVGDVIVAVCSHWDTYISHRAKVSRITETLLICSDASGKEYLRVKKANGKDANEGRFSSTTYYPAECAYVKKLIENAERRAAFNEIVEKVQAAQKAHQNDPSAFKAALLSISES